MCPAGKKKLAIGYVAYESVTCFAGDISKYIPILKKGLAIIGYVAYECVTCFVGDISRIGCAPLKKKGVGCWVCRV